MACVPCAAPAMGVIGWTLVVLAVVLSGVGFLIIRSLPVVGVALYWAGLGAYRYLSGAVLRKPVGTKDTELPPRRFARHVHATLRITLPALVVLGLVYPWFGAMLVVTTGVVAPAMGVQYLHARAVQRAKVAGTPIRVHAEIGADR